MQTLILTSSLGMSVEDEAGNKYPCTIPNTNHILDVMKSHLPHRSKMVYVASAPDNYEITDNYANMCFASMDMTMPFEEYVILDGRNCDKGEEIIQDADMILLAGGHVPTQNKFFNRINLASILSHTKALIVGISAGSMNSANIVYAMPEEPGEAADQQYNRWLRGLNLTPISILPHYNSWADGELDGYALTTDIMLPDSHIRPMIAYSDGTYILQQANQYTLYGEAILVTNGTTTALGTPNSATDITDLICKIYTN